ncbi:hypothetical protein ABL78_4648 [Leptomonas seymouri]|uniref:Uncharacterized protein n=1 Tax=Leptomonas seymouri TaxID=5684 RepID=A0A0N1I643_LEPSE|nr:hypothetical protein ABL78_4648 [Leptomonas seymouri]|eukprot:KPI86301.1 hypothetical protein ABL78_4648 [Leptomonas seymouri]
MVRVGAKRERPCMVLLHVALRSAAIPAAEGQPRPKPGAGVTPPPAASPERYVWKSRLTAELYASAVLSRVRAWWEMLGGVRYGLPDSVRLASAVWDDEAGRERNAQSTIRAARAGAVGAASAKQPGRRGRATQRRSGVLRCVARLSRALAGDAAALHVFRAACACVTEVHVSLPRSSIAPGAVTADVVDEVEADGPRRRRQRVEDSGPRMEQGCHAAVRVARVEHVVTSRRSQRDKASLQST